jgi:hypothetical protein
MARIKKLLPLLVVVLLAVIVFALFQMQIWPFGGSDDSANATVTTQVAVKHPSTSTTGTNGTTATTAVPDAQQYLTAMNDWYTTYWIKADIKAVAFKKALSPTSKEVQRVKDFASAMHASLASVKGITPPQPAAQFHAVFCAVLTDEVKGVDRLIRAITSKNKRDMELALRYFTEAHEGEVAAMTALQPYLTASGNAGPTG